MVRVADMTTDEIQRVVQQKVRQYAKGAEITVSLPNDRTHQVKAQALYLFKWGTSVGLNQLLFSGTPVTRQVPIIAPDNYPIRYLGRGSDGRTPMLSQSDLFVQHAIKIGGGREIQVNATVLNLFNQRTAVNKITTLRRTASKPWRRRARFVGCGPSARVRRGSGRRDDQPARAEASAGRRWGWGPSAK